MDNRPLLFLDSGIGGIPYCRHFVSRNPLETVCYLADRRHFPYGTKKQEELIDILITLLEKLVKTLNPKIIVLACNTATVSALTELRRHFPKHLFVGTVPAIKPAMQAGKTGMVGVLGTERTINDPYINDLAGGGCRITGIAAPELVEFVEQKIFLAGKEEKEQMAEKYIQIFRSAGADTLVLGCTHFLFLQDEFKQKASPFIKGFDSMEGITHRIESLLDDKEGALRAHDSSQNKILLSGTEAPESSWENLAQDMRFSLSLLDKS
jgi:glutamate racemase